MGAAKACMHPNNLSVSPQVPVPLDHDAYLHVHYPAVDPSVPIPLCDEVDVTQRGGLQIPEAGGWRDGALRYLMRRGEGGGMEG